MESTSARDLLLGIRPGDSNLGVLHFGNSKDMSPCVVMEPTPFRYYEIHRDALLQHRIESYRRVRQLNLKCETWAIFHKKSVASFKPLSPRFCTSRLEGDEIRATMRRCVYRWVCLAAMMLRDYADARVTWKRLDPKPLYLRYGASPKTTFLFPLNVLARADLHQLKNSIASISISLQPFLDHASSESLVESITGFLEEINALEDSREAINELIDRLDEKGRSLSRKRSGHTGTHTGQGRAAAKVAATEVSRDCRERDPSGEAAVSNPPGNADRR